ncbi:hypothetical protein [Microbacterium dauci]|uniref:Right handed beta helix domain-containing protein n=1 Tax=Microbacterium dauci TaxID=3048008 RepID=A0ABT6ZET5_9MICO|nr:hypothetical protein [Microbacterium sp. LX3-4]MDJ1114496.1 hypothetical protein [Microbacterium sp. LX3-4]
MSEPTATEERRGPVGWIALAVLVALVAAVVGVILVTAERPRAAAGPGVVDVDDAAVERAGVWIPAPGGGIVGTGTIRMAFEGRAISWTANGAALSGTVKVRIDDETVSTVTRDDVDPAGIAVAVSDLSPGRHVLEIDASGGRASLVAFQVFESAAAAAPPPVREVARTLGGIELRLPPSDDAATTRWVLRSIGGRAFERIASIPATQTTYMDHVSPVASTDIAYALASETSTTTSSAASSVRRTPSAHEVGVSYPRLADCPSADVTADPGDDLQDALDALTPGDVLKVRAGVYDGAFSIRATGTADDPIWVCAEGAVLRGESTDRGYGLHIADSSHVIVAGVRVERSRKGVMVDRSDHIVFVDGQVHDTGNEAIHLRARTTDSVIAHTQVRDTGLQEDTPRPEWGEGIYVGSHYSNWCATTYEGCTAGCIGGQCEPDRSDRNAILFNDIARTSAEAVDVKEGAVDGVIAGNVIRMDGRSDAARWIVLRSRDWVVVGNEGRTTIPMNGIEIYRPPVEGWGTGNLVLDNAATFPTRDAAAGYAVEVRHPGNVVGCENRLTGAASDRLTNVECEVVG